MNLVFNKKLFFIVLAVAALSMAFLFIADTAEADYSCISNRTGNQFCSSSGSYNTASCTNCSSLDGWYLDGGRYWVSSGACTEKEVQRYKYLNGVCISGCTRIDSGQREVRDTGNTRNKSDETSCGTNMECSGGSCVSSCAPNYGNTCTPTNACGQSNSGTYSCSGSCSVSAPALPSWHGDPCTQCNNVGECNTGTIGCSSGSCSVGAPANKTLFVSASATPSSPQVNEGVAVQATVSGTATGNVVYSLDCQNDGTYEQSITRSGNSYNFTRECSYTSPGDKTIKVVVQRQGLSATDSTIRVNVQTPAPVVTISASPIDAKSGGSDSSTITWSSTYATSCTASGSWSGAKTTSGSQARVFPTATTYTFSLECSGVGGRTTNSTYVRAHSPPILSVDPSGNVLNGISVIYTATVAINVSLTPYYIRIYEGSTIRANCYYGTTCSYTASGTSATKTFIAKLTTSGGSVFLNGNTVSTTWVAPTSQLRASDFSFEPTTIKVKESTIVRGWLKDSLGNGIGGKTVTLQYWNGPMSSWIETGVSGTTETSGANRGYTSFTFTPNSGFIGSLNYRLNFAGDANYIGSSSSYKILNVNLNLDFPNNTWQRLWYEDPENNAFAANSYLGEGPNEANEKFTNDWSIGFSLTGSNYGSRYDDVGFRSGRSISFSEGWHTFYVGADDGIKLFIDGILKTSANAWGDHSFTNNQNTIIADISAGDHDIEIDYYEDGSYAKIQFDYDSGITNIECMRGISCFQSVGYIGCNAHAEDDGWCYYNGSPSPGSEGCTADPIPSACSAYGKCTYTDRCIPGAGEACTPTGCGAPEAIPPTAEITSPSEATWKNAGNLSVSVTDQDNEELDINACKYSVWDAGRGIWSVGGSTYDSAASRTCSSTVSVTVGSTGNCQSSGIMTCQVRVWAKDRAGNISNVAAENSAREYDIDLERPTAKITEILPSPIFPVSGQAWLNARSGGDENRLYSISIEYGDTGGSGLETCVLQIRNGVSGDWSARSVACGGTNKDALFNLVVGPKPGSDCSILSATTETKSCTLWARVWDRARNQSEAWTVRPNRSDYAVQSTNYFFLQVDWEGPDVE